MQQPLSSAARPIDSPRFYITGRQPLRPGAVLLAIVVAFALVGGIVYAMERPGGFRLTSSSDATPTGSGSGVSAGGDDESDDPNQIDTIVLGDPTEAPVPAHRGERVSSVHPTILVRLPRSGGHFGQIPDSDAGRLLYAWLAAFNQANSSALARALPAVSQAAVTHAQMQLRRETGGFTLLSAREVEPGIMVFRLRDQAPSPTEVLGTLRVRDGFDPPVIADFSLRAIAPLAAEAPLSEPGHP
jgi:hypothetical protein